MIFMVMIHVMMMMMMMITVYLVTKRCSDGCFTCAVQLGLVFQHAIASFPAVILIPDLPVDHLDPELPLLAVWAEQDCPLEAGVVLAVSV